MDCKVSVIRFALQQPNLSQKHFEVLTYISQETSNMHDDEIIHDIESIDELMDVFLFLGWVEIESSHEIYAEVFRHKDGKPFTDFDMQWLLSKVTEKYGDSHATHEHPDFFKHFEEFSPFRPSALSNESKVNVFN